MKYVSLVISLQIWWASWAQQAPGYPLPTDLRDLSLEDTVSFYLCDQYQVKLLFSHRGKVREMHFAGADSLIKHERTIKSGRVVRFYNTQGVQTGPEVSMDSRNHIKYIASYSNGRFNCWSYIYSSKKRILKEINLYNNGVRNPCVIVWDNKGNLFIDNCLLKDGLFRCL